MINKYDLDIDKIAAYLKLKKPTVLDLFSNNMIPNRRTGAGQYQATFKALDNWLSQNDFDLIECESLNCQNTITKRRTSRRKFCSETCQNTTTKARRRAQGLKN